MAAPAINAIEDIAGLLKGETVILMFSTGKDSIVAGDLLFKHWEDPVYPVFMYFVEGLSIKQRMIDYYSKRWNVKIEQVPHFIHLNLKTGKKYKMADIERGLRSTYNASYIVQGYKKNDSMARRGMLSHLPHGIDERNKKIYPVADWSDKQILSYIKLNKLPLPVEYQHGYKNDFGIPDARALTYLKNNFPDDYRKVIATFPQLEALVWDKEH